MASVPAKPLPVGKDYHFNIIYNQAKSKLAKTEDTKISLEVTEFAVEKLAKWGYSKSYYADRDALPNKNVLGQLVEVIDKSCFTIVVFTNGFLANCWLQYCNMDAFKKLLDKKEDSPRRLIFILFGVNDKHLQNHLSLNHYISLTRADWNMKSGESEWNKLKNMMENPVARPESKTAAHEKKSLIAPHKVQENNKLEPSASPLKEPVKTNPLKTFDQLQKTYDQNGKTTDKKDGLPNGQNKSFNSSPNDVKSRNLMQADKKEDVKILSNPVVKKVKSENMQTDKKAELKMSSRPVAVLESEIEQNDVSLVQLSNGPTLCAPEHSNADIKKNGDVFNEVTKKDDQQTVKAPFSQEEKEDKQITNVKSEIKKLEENANKMQVKEKVKASLSSMRSNTSMTAADKNGKCIDDQRTENDSLGSMPDLSLGRKLDGQKHCRSLSVGNVYLRKEVSYKQALFKALCHNVYGSVQPYI